jgi:CRISPR-associated endoribonuclease Cas6
MRIRIIFLVKNKGATVPFHHQYLLSSFIKDCLKNTDESIKKDYFYNFSGLKGQTKVSRNGLHFYSSRVTLVVASINKEWIDTLIKNIFNKKEIKIANLWLEPELVQQEIYHHNTNEMKYVCISPLVLCKTNADDCNFSKKFISPELDFFSDLLYDSTMERMEISGRFTEEEITSFRKFQLVPDENYLKRIKKDQKKFARIYNVGEQVRKEVRGYTLPFTLYADSKVQDFVFNCGLGTFTEEGYGMIDVIRDGLIQHTEIYYKPTK